MNRDGIDNGLLRTLTEQSQDLNRDAVWITNEALTE